MSATSRPTSSSVMEAQNAGAKVILDVVPYKTVVEQLPVQLAAGQGPDILRVAEIGGLSKNYIDISAHVKDRKYWEDNFGSTLPWMRNKAGDKGIYGFLSQMTMTGPFVNKTLFEQAKVPMPGPKATWDEWPTRRARWPRPRRPRPPWPGTARGHRFAGPAVSYGAKIFDAKETLPWTPATRPPWASSLPGTRTAPCSRTSGAARAAPAMPMRGGRVQERPRGDDPVGFLADQPHAKEIGNAFDWVAVPNPCGPRRLLGHARRRGLGGAEKPPNRLRKWAASWTSWRRRPTSPNSPPAPTISRPTPAWPKKA